MSSLSNSSKPRTSCGRVGLGLAGHGCLAPSSVLDHVMRAGGRWDALTDLKSKRQNLNQRSRQRKQQSPLRLRFPLIQRCWIQYASSRRSLSRPCRRSLAVPQWSINQSSPTELDLHGSVDPSASKDLLILSHI